MSNRGGFLKGTITTYKTKGGLRYRVQMPPEIDPVRQRPYRPSATFDTIQEAEEWRREQSMKLAHRGSLPTNATLGEVIEYRLAQSGLKESTISSNAVAAKRLPKWLLNTPIKNITQGVITRWVTEDLVKLPLKSGTVLNILGTVSAAFEFAQQNGVISGNPVKACGARRLVLAYVHDVEDYDDDGLDDDEWRTHQLGRGPIWTPEQLRRFCETEPYPYKYLWLLMILQAVRRGEALGMRWESIDLERGIAGIRENVTWGKDGTIFSPTPKGGRRRRILLDPMTVWGLRRHKELQDREKAEYDTWDLQGWVFTRRRWHRNRRSGWWPGAHMVPVTVTARVDQAARKFGYPRMGPHGFRRSWATIAETVGVPPRVRRDILGHSPESMTDRYSRSTREEMAKGLEMVRQVIFPDWSPDL